MGIGDIPFFVWMTVPLSWEPDSPARLIIIQTAMIFLALASLFVAYRKFRKVGFLIGLAPCYILNTLISNIIIIGIQ